MNLNHKGIPMTKENHTGIKHDQGKPRFSLMPPLAEMEVVKVLTFGAEKYAPDNWRGIDPIRYVDAAGRHINATRRGEQADDESGLHHLAHAICCLMFQLEKALESGQAPQQPTAVTFSINDLPMIGQAYHYRSNAGVVYERRWQSTPQEWKRLAAGQVFKTSEACTDAEHTEAYIFHEDDPVKVPDIGGQMWIIRCMGNGGSLRWVVDNRPYLVASKDIGPGGTGFTINHPTGFTINHPNGWYEQGELFDSKERAEAKAFWRNVSMQRHGTPYGPLHPDAKQYDEPFPGNDEGGEHE